MTGEKEGDGDGQTMQDSQAIGGILTFTELHGDCGSDVSSSAFSFQIVVLNQRQVIPQETFDVWRHFQCHS